MSGDAGYKATGQYSLLAVKGIRNGECMRYHARLRASPAGENTHAAQYQRMCGAVGCVMLRWYAYVRQPGKVMANKGP